MTTTPGRPSVGYRLRIAGRLDPGWSSWFDGWVVDVAADGTTSLSGEVADQAQLHGLLSKIRDLGLGLLSLEVIAERPEA